MNWVLLQKICFFWLLCALAVMLYDTYLIWFEQSRIEWLQPNHRIKTGLLAFPALGLYYFTEFKIRRTSASQDT